MTGHGTLVHESTALLGQDGRMVALDSQDIDARVLVDCRTGYARRAGIRS